MQVTRVIPALALAAGLAALPGPLAAQKAATVSVVFSGLPSTWRSQENTMDDIWRPLGARGVNYYAFGAPVLPNAYAARSDPASPLYQAWLGAYVVHGGLDRRSASVDSVRRRLILGLATLDQRSWLAAMGDSAPVAELVAPMRRSHLIIDGAERVLYTGDLRSHSDLSVAATPLARSIGMPDRSAWGRDLTPFHDLILHVQAAVWYDVARDVTIIVYGASSAFATKSGVRRDNGPELDATLRALMRRAHVRESADTSRHVGADLPGRVVRPEAQQTAPPNPPVAPVRPVTDDYYGTKVVDDYRWMENLKEPETQRWMKAQADYTRATLDALPGHPALLARVDQLDTSEPAQVTGVQIVGGHTGFGATRQQEDADTADMLALALWQTGDRDLQPDRK